MGATRSGRETQGSPQAHARARTGTYTTTPYTHVRRTRQGPETRSQGGAAGRAWAGLGGLGRAWQSLPTRPCKGLRNRRRLQPAPPSPGRVQWEPGGGKGCVPVPCCAGSRGSGRGEALGAGPRRLLNRPSHGRKQTLPGYPLELPADCSPIFFPLFTSRGALHLQPCCWLLSVLPCWLGKPSGPLLPPGQDKDPQENSSSGCYFTGFPTSALWPLRRPQPVVFGGASAGGVAGILGACFNYYKAEKDMLGLSFLSNWGSGIEGLKLGRRA